METIRNTHPLMLGAAASVIVVSLLGAAAITGILPSARSDKAEMPAQKPNTSETPVRKTDKTETPTLKNALAPAQARHRAERLAAGEDRCTSCGTVDAIRSVEVNGAGTGLGAVAGGVTGAVVGNQIGRGNGNTAMTLLGAAGGAFAGNEIEKKVKRHYTYRITLRMDDGSFRTMSQSAAPAVGVGERVRIIDGAIVARS